MARQKGMLNLSGNLEPLAGAPLDSRTITPTVADLYIASNWPYKYIGMKTTVTATGETYRLVNLDVTQESSWVLDGGSGGQTIQVESMPMATESDLGKVLQYIGTTNLNYTNGYFYKCVYKNNLYLWEQQNVQPDAEGQTIQVSELPTADIGQTGKVYQYIGDTGNGLVHGYFYECVLNDGSYVWQETEVNKPTEALSSSDMEDVKGAFSPVIESVGGLPILFDEGGTERQVGWYRYANGTKQPVYEKNVALTNPIWVAPATGNKNVVSSYTSVGASINDVINCTTMMITKTTKEVFYPFISYTVSGNILNETEPTWDSFACARVVVESNTSQTNPNTIRLLTNIQSYCESYDYISTIRYTKTTDTPA